MQPTAPAAKVRSILCPNCGGTVELRGFEYTRSAVCVQCCTILDTSTPEIKILQKFDERNRERPIIPLGTRGKLHGTLYEVIGFMVRTISVEGVVYAWHEYLLFNPYKGFRYLTCYNGHWNDVVTARGLPEAATWRGRKAAKYLGETYGHFQNAMARTAFVMGEFPWAVKVGDHATVDDYVSPPYMLSCEISSGEVNWSHGVYIEGADVWKAFNMQGAPPVKEGVFANQPSPYTGKIAAIWKRAALLLGVWLLLLVGLNIFAMNREVYKKVFTFRQGTPGEQSLVTDVFEIPGRTSTVDVNINTNLDNDWAYFSLALINEQTGQGFDFGRQVSYYHGRDSDGNWSEGSKGESVTLPRIAAGRYYLRIEPEMDQNTFAQQHAVNYEIVVKRDAPGTFWFWIALPLLLIPPIITTIRSAAFEGRRWKESDYAPSSSSDD